MFTYFEFFFFFKNCIKNPYLFLKLGRFWNKKAKATPAWSPFPTCLLKSSGVIRFIRKTEKNLKRVWFLRDFKNLLHEVLSTKLSLIKAIVYFFPVYFKRHFYRENRKMKQFSFILSTKYSLIKEIVSSFPVYFERHFYEENNETKQFSFIFKLIQLCF